MRPRTSALRSAAAVALAVLALAPAASAATFRQAGPEGGPVSLVPGPGQVLALGSGGRIWRLAGEVWRECAPLPAATGDGGFARASVDASGTILAVAGGRLVRGGADCATWAATAAPQGIVAVAATVGAGAAIVAVDAAGRAFRSSDGGRTWVAAARLPRGLDAEVARAGAQTLLVQGDTTTACSADGGRTWRSIERWDPGLTVVGADGAIWRLRTGGDGEDEVVRAAGCGAPPRAVSAAGGGENLLWPLGTDAAGDGLLGFGEGRLARADRATLVAQRGPRLRSVAIGAVEAPDGRILVATYAGVDAVDGGLVRRGDQGLRATLGGLPAVLEGGTRLVLGGLLGADAGASDDGGATWLPVAVDSPDGFEAAAALGRRSVALIGRGDDDGAGRVLLSADAGRTWERGAQGTWTHGDLLGDPAEETGWSVLDSGGILRTRDGGRTWRRLSRLGGDGARSVARDGGLVLLAETVRGLEVVRIARDGRVRRQAARGLRVAGCDAEDGRLALTPGGGLVATSCGAVFRSRTGRRFSRDARGLPRYPRQEFGFPTTVVVDARTGRTVLGRVDGLFVQDAPGRRWRRVGGAPREVAAVIAAGDRLLVVSVDRGLLSVDPAEL